jgi:type I restriction enzyme S subunit
MIKVILKDIVEKPITGEWGNEGNSVNVLRTTNFTNEGFINYAKVVKREVEQKKIDLKKLLKGDIIIEKSGGSPTQPVGRVVYFDSEEIFLCNNFTAILRPKKEQVFPKYLHYLLFVGHQFGLTSAFQNKTTGIINLQLTKYLEGTKIPLPPLPQQQKIANILDAADALRQKDKALLAKFDELTQALFLDMFGDPVSNPKGWGIMNLGEITDLVTDGKHGNCSDEPGSGYYFVSAKDIRNNKINYLNSREIPKAEFEEVDKRTNLQPGDLVMINTGATIGRMAIASDIPETRRSTFQKSVAVIKVKKDIISSFFLQYVFELGLETFANMGSGSAIKNLLLSEMRRFNIILPSLHLQNQFAERVQVIEQQKAIAQKSLEKSEELFNSLLQKAFKGELVSLI